MKRHRRRNQRAETKSSWRAKLHSAYNFIINSTATNFLLFELRKIYKNIYIYFCIFLSFMKILAWDSHVWYHALKFLFSIGELPTIDHIESIVRLLTQWSCMRSDQSRRG